MGSRRRAWMIGFVACVWVVCGGVTALLARAIVRTLRPADRVSLRIDPPEQVHLPDPTLGYRTGTGRFTITKTLTDPATGRGRSFAYTATMDDRGQRITGPPSAADTPDRPEVWVFGCSFTWGMGLQDHETYP